mmetsp:Transcript_78/g.157  ORF Transcript_78/g.157 Transcript_78/m.157 type:complete len:337 (-) Transcript_78:69-1079(-)
MTTIKYFLSCYGVVLFFSRATLTLSLSLKTRTPSKVATTTTRTKIEKNRRDVLQSSFSSIAATAGLVGGVGVFSQPMVASAESITTTTPSNNGLASKLAKRDPAVLRNSVFNVPPSAQVYPSFLRGSWDVSSQFNGYIFPSDKIPKSKVLNDFIIPGFQKCSIASIADIGKEGSVQYTMKIDETSGLQDRNGDLASQINAYLGYKAVANVIHDPKTNPNRLSIVFVEYKTRNAERIELFCNARESELYTDESTNRPIFVNSEYIRQVTFGGGPDVGVARQVVGNYAHFTTWKQVDENHLKGNILTAAYLDPQDPLFFDEPSKPVAIYSHVLSATRA